jgi:thiamine biosynthesis lipoprotein
MGSRFDITVVAEDQKAADQFIQKAENEIVRIENLISSWKPDSQISEVNRMAGKAPVKVDPEVIQLIERALTLSKITDGAFDISYASMDQVWKFDGSMDERMPSQEAIRASVSKIGYQHIVLDKQAETVFLEKPGMKIGFGAIGKGYAADRAKALLIKMGVASGIINASGDLITWGRKPDQSEWMVGITNPLNKTKFFSWLPLTNKAIATSGNYEKKVIIDGVEFSHIIDPRTGYPVRGISSVSILSDSAELSDALATSVFVLGIEKGLFLIDQLERVECLIVDSENQMHFSKQLKSQSE